VDDRAPNVTDQPTNEQPAEQEPDYRFTLANERTYLAYLRTALACYAGGLSAVQFLDVDGGRALPKVIGVVLVLAGMVVTAGAWQRWRQNMAAMRRGAPLPASRLPLILATTIGLVGVGGLLFTIIR
jgi:putative membrane protein